MNTPPHSNPVPAPQWISSLVLAIIVFVVLLMLALSTKSGPGTPETNDALGISHGNNPDQSRGINQPLP